MSFILKFFTEHWYIYLLLFLYFDMYILDFFYKKFFFFNFNFNLNFIKNSKKNQKIWIEIWNIDTKISKLENIPNTPWNLYLKYKLSMLNSWHILEERFFIFFIIFLFNFF